MARVYATSAQYEALTGVVPAPAGMYAQLGRASAFLDSRVFRLCWYEADAVTGMPTNEVVLAAFAAATCAQAQEWDDTGDERGAAGRYSSVKLGTLALSGPASSSGGTGATGGRTVADAALEALRTPDLTADLFVLGMVTS